VPGGELVNGPDPERAGGRRYLAFDIETAKVLPEHVTDLRRSLMSPIVLRADAADYELEMDQMTRKQRHFESYSIQKDRTPDGKARR